MPHGPGARVPARPDGTEGEDARSGGVTQTKKYAARIVRTLVIDARTRIAIRQARAASRPKSAPLWQGRMEFRVACAPWCSALVRWREDKAMILHCKFIPAGDTARPRRFHSQIGSGDLPILYFPQFWCGIAARRALTGAHLGAAAERLPMRHQGGRNE